METRTEMACNDAALLAFERQSRSVQPEDPATLEALGWQAAETRQEWEDEYRRWFEREVMGLVANG
jgi:hypothetical protein